MTAIAPYSVCAAPQAVKSAHELPKPDFRATRPDTLSGRRHADCREEGTQTMPARTAPLPLLPQRRHSDGFTLIELMIVIAVLAIAGLAAAPSLTERLATNAVKGAANEAFADLHYARSESVQRNATVNVNFGASGYTITTGASTTLKAVTLAGPTLAAGHGARIVFSPIREGVVVSGMPVEFSHQRSGATLRVSVNKLGRAEICSAVGAMAGYSAC
jgi:prepilin-type N-terminal cleavage/methylation domain-containing protein